MGSLVKSTYDNMCEMYGAGTRVEAVNVAGIRESSRGNVIKVLKSGDIRVNFDKYGEITVKYPEELVRVIHNGVGCNLGMKKGKKRYVECNEDCMTCGWNPAVEKQRKKAIDNGDMIDDNGVKRLVVKKQNNLSCS